jgi:hypothetical protein
MMERTERRRDKRLGERFELLCHAVGSTAGKPCDGRTVNVSSGGLYFETTGTFEPGNLLRVELSIPPTPGLLEFGGRIAGFARVLRAHSIGKSSADEEPSCERYGVAIEFCRPLRLCI